MATVAQVLPVHRKSNAVVALVPNRDPVAHAVPPGANATAPRPESAGALTATLCQVFPVHRMLIGAEGPPKPVPLAPVPTTNAVPPGPAAAPLRLRWMPPLNGEGVAVVLHVLPFHRARPGVGMPWLL